MVKASHLDRGFPCDKVKSVLAKGTLAHSMREIYRIHPPAGI